MDGATHILILVRHGHFRSSLIALLKTQPGVELSLVEDIREVNKEFLLKATSPLILADLDGLGSAGLERLTMLRKLLPTARCLALVDNVYQPGILAAYSDNSYSSLGVDCVLAKSISAGELLRTVQQMITGRERPVFSAAINLTWL